MSGKAPRDKGNRGEWELVRICESHGLSCKRTPCSKKPDLTVEGRPVSVKRRANGMEWAYRDLEDHDYILFRTDRRGWLQIRLWPIAKIDK